MRAGGAGGCEREGLPDGGIQGPRPARAFVYPAARPPSASWRALARLEAHPMPVHVRRMRPLYHGIGIAAPLYLQVAFANVWLFGPLLKRWLTAQPEMNASIRSTTALTIIRGGVEDNTVHRKPAPSPISASCPGIPSPTCCGI